MPTVADDELAIVEASCSARFRACGSPRQVLLDEDVVVDIADRQRAVLRIRLITLRISSFFTDPNQESAPRDAA